MRATLPLALVALVFAFWPAADAFAQDVDEAASEQPAEATDEANEAQPSRSNTPLPEAAASSDAAVLAKPPAKSSEIRGPGAPKGRTPKDEEPQYLPVALPDGADKTGVSSQAISVPQGAGKIQGMGESFSTQLSTGVATFGVPFAIPPARGAAGVSLSLSYSSAGGPGVAGMGWNVPVPFIARQTDRGLPRYEDLTTWHPNQDRFVFNGGQELVPICVVEADLSCAGAITTPVAEGMPDWSATWMYFRPRVEGGFLRFFWSADHKTWRVQDKSGVIMELGVEASPGDLSYLGALEVDPQEPGRIFRWNLVRQYDQHVDGEGRPVNVISYRYETFDGLGYLTDVFYTPPASQAGVATLNDYAHHVILRYETRPDAPWSYRRGWPTRMSRRLVGVDVVSKPFGSPDSPRRLTRRYHLNYDPAYHVSLLASVQVEGRCAPAPALSPDDYVLEGDLSAPTNCQTLPAMTFGYEHVEPFDTAGNPSVADLPGYEGFDERILTMTSSPDHSIDEDQTDLFDIDSNGLPDVLVTMPGLFGGKHGVFFNGASGNPDEFGPGTIGVVGVLGADANTIKLSNGNVRALDLDADATINLVHMPAVKEYSIYTPKKTNGQWNWHGTAITTASNQNVKIDFTGDAPDLRIMDVNGDGLVDVVHSAGTQYKTFFSLGRHPGGVGQFGHATWTSATSAQISNDFVGACVPWAGLPVQFGSNEVKIADMNGDGFPDIVRVLKGNIKYWPGRGNGFWGTGALDDCPAGTFGANRDVAMASSPNYSDINGDSLRLDDVNGDGLDDLVQVRFDAVDVWLNVDGTGWTDRHIVDGTPASPSFAERVRLVDVNGSGTRDILWGNSKNYRYIDLSGGARPWVLTHVDNGLGKTTELEYSTSAQLSLIAAKANAAWSSFTPTPVHVVTKVIEKDNLSVANHPTGVYETEYNYRDPVYDGLQREFRGFRYATTTRIGDANSPTSTSASTFLLGECKVDCTAANAWKDNPREALKGLPVLTEAFDTAGAYLSTTHQTYTLRALYSGLDARVVSHAFVSATDAYLYDTSPFVKPQPEPKEQLAEVIVEGSPPEVVGVSMRSVVGRAHTRTEATVDAFGNAVDQIAKGCVDGCPESPEEHILTHTAPGRPIGDTTGWLWRTLSSYVSGNLHGDVHRNSMHMSYDELGRLTGTTADLDGTLPLDRFHAQAGTVAPAPPNASSNGNGIFISSAEYDDFGHVVFGRGAVGRCRAIAYDGPFAELPVSETIFAGALGPNGPPGSPPPCGLTALTTTIPSDGYDRGLGVVMTALDLHGEKTEVHYDEFGRPEQLWHPHPATAGQVSPQPSLKIEYLLGKPYSRIHTETQDAKLLGDPQYHHAWAYVDGFGRTIVTLTEADVNAGDDLPWIASGLTEYDKKGASKRALLPCFFGGIAAAYPMGTVPTGPLPCGIDQSQRYDAFGRPIESRVAGALVLKTYHHALSRDLWDAADVGPSPHQDTPASQRSDGHGRALVTTERAKAGTPPQIEERHTKTTYLPTGEIEKITRVRGADQVIRWMRYDTLGRRVLNVEPHTTKDFTANLTADPSSMKAWRYAYDDAGELVGTSDARGCGSNYHYDAAGRILAEDYSPCLGTHQIYSPPNLAAKTGVEVLFHYDVVESVAPPEFQDATLLKGRLVSVSDRASRTVTRFDGRGRVTAAGRQIAKPGTPADDLASRYAPHWYKRYAHFDAADRPIQASTAAEHADLIGVEIADLGGGIPAGARSTTVETEYSARGTVKKVGGSYESLVKSVDRTADGLVSEIVYGDVSVASGMQPTPAATTTFTYDMRRRLITVQTDRGPPNLWTTQPQPPPGYSPPPDYGGLPSTFQLILQDDEFQYDLVDNPIEIRDWRTAAEWPVGAKPVTRNIQYDDLYRVKQVDYEYVAGDDTWVSPFDHENTALPSELDPRRALPSPHVSFDKRVLSQTFQYDWLGNTVSTDDDAHGFYDRSLGAVTNNTAAGKPYQLTSGVQATGSRKGHLDATYDDAGNLKSLIVWREGPCLPAIATCSQRFSYDWDEVGRLVDARRWDFHFLSPVPDDLAPTAARLTHAYDANDQRVIKTAYPPVAGINVHTLYVFPSFELRRAEWDALASDYERTNLTEVPYLIAHGARLARVVYEDPAKGVPSYGEPPTTPPKLHILFELGDHLGSTSVVLDKATGEVVERSTFQAYGGAETDYRPERWQGFREDCRFTGKEEDIEVGLTYFGKRFLAPLVGRWTSPDPLTLHAYDADFNLYAYVRGRALVARDPLGLSEDETLQMSTDNGVGESTPGAQMSSGKIVRAYEPRTGPTERSSMAWANPYSEDFQENLQNDLEDTISSNNAKWESGAEERRETAHQAQLNKSTREQDERMWTVAGGIGTAPRGYAHTGPQEWRNEGHASGVEDVADGATIGSTVGGIAKSLYRAGASSRFVHNKYVQFVRPGAKERVAYPSWSSKQLGVRRWDDYARIKGARTAFEANTTPWATMTQEQLSRKLGQAAADAERLSAGAVDRVIWFGTEPLPNVGFGGALKSALQQSGIEYWHVPW